MIFILPGQRIAAFTPFQVAQDSPPHTVGIAVVPAAHVLTKVAADSPHSANLWSRHRFGGLGQQVILLLNHRRLGYVLQLSQSPYLQSADILTDMIQVGDGLDVDDSLRVSG